MVQTIFSLKDAKALWQRQKSTLKTRKVKLTTNALQSIDEINISRGYA